MNANVGDYGFSDKEKNGKHQSQAYII